MDIRVESMAIALYTAGCGWPPETWNTEATLPSCRTFYRKLARAALDQLAAAAN